MPVADLFASSRRILRNLLGRSRRAAWAAAIVPLGSIGANIAGAAPTATLPPEFPAIPFSMRITDMERVPGDAEGDAFRVEFQALSWHASMDAIILSMNEGTSSVDGTAPHFAGASVDHDGRGGAAGGSDIGPGVFDPVGIHSGWGRGDIPDRLNDWEVTSQTSTQAWWDNYDPTIPSYPYTGRQVPNYYISSDTLPVEQRVNSVPGFGLDGLGDSAFDGGPGPYTPSSPGGGVPVDPVVNGDPWVGRNVLDGFVIDIDDWDVGEVFSVNWLLASLNFDSGGTNHRLYILEWDETEPSPFTHGVMNLVRVDPSIGAAAGELPGAVFVDNAGFDQSNTSFYDTVYEIPNPAEFAAEFGQGITAAFVNPADNVFNMAINTSLVPEPGAAWLACGGLLAFAAARRLIKTD